MNQDEVFPSLLQSPFISGDDSEGYFYQTTYENVESQLNETVDQIDEEDVMPIGKDQLNNPSLDIVIPNQKEQQIIPHFDTGSTSIQRGSTKITDSIESSRNKATKNYQKKKTKNLQKSHAKTAHNYLTKRRRKVTETGMPFVQKLCMQADIKEEDFLKIVKRVNQIKSWSFDILKMIWSGEHLIEEIRELKQMGINLNLKDVDRFWIPYQKYTKVYFKRLIVNNATNGKLCCWKEMIGTSQTYHESVSYTHLTLPTIYSV
eukprot:TRINITY_DN5983_c0_g3_i2.p1 TRINITY_DN5983_c0_g3~~TRINITY_DN5983_c0_g3_i2.p1  ORF type:complete len:261 (+),score=31.18 TRINITY_DN5983_c0_g3_i2:34-816(+)